MQLSVNRQIVVLLGISTISILLTFLFSQAAFYLWILVVGTAGMAVLLAFKQRDTVSNESGKLWIYFIIFGLSFFAFWFITSSMP